MLIGLILFVLGIVVIVANPILGFIPGVLLIVAGIVVMVLGGLARGIGAITGIGSTRICPACRSRIPSGAVVCRYCGYRYS